MQGKLPIGGVVRVAVAAIVGLQALPVSAQTTVSELQFSAERALSRLVAGVPAARALSKDAVAVLVFPRISRAGFVFGVQYGEGVLFRAPGESTHFRDLRPAGYYRNFGGSWGLQAGAQQFGYALFFMTEPALAALTNTSGFEIGVGPTVVVVDQGRAASLTTMNAGTDIYAFIFSQRGLMAGLGLQGNRITQISR